MHIVFVVTPPHRISLEVREDYRQRYEIFLTRCDAHPVLSSSEWRLAPSNWLFPVPDHEKSVAHLAQMATSFGLRYWQEYFDEDPLRCSD